jgi:putative pyruvate formate lyase activating enzyme
VRVSSVFPHHGEESCLSGSRGSGAVFFGGCNLGCVFCQNHDISRQEAGQSVSARELAAMMLALQEAGCHNVNFVTPSHVVPQILEALLEAIPRGLVLPLVFNTGGYDLVETLGLLDGVMDLYMPDFKFWEPETADRLASARDYPERARAAIREMHRQTGVLQCDARGLARRGLLVRHLVMPGQVQESAAIFRWLATELSPDTFVNVMAQYHPEHQVGRRGGEGKVLFPEINRRPRLSEMEEARAAARAAGLRRFDD